MNVNGSGFPLKKSQSTVLSHVASERNFLPIRQFTTTRIKDAISPPAFSTEAYAQCCGSGMFIPADPKCLHPGSRILIKELKYFKPKKTKKWLLSSKKYDPGCSSRIPDPDADFLPSRIPDPGVKKAPDPGSATLLTPPSPLHFFGLRAGPPPPHPIFINSFDVSSLEEGGGQMRKSECVCTHLECCSKSKDW